MTPKLKRQQSKAFLQMWVLSHLDDARFVEPCRKLIPPCWSMHPASWADTAKSFRWSKCSSVCHTLGLTKLMFSGSHRPVSAITQDNLINNHGKNGHHVGNLSRGETKNEQRRDGELVLFQNKSTPTVLRLAGHWWISSETKNFLWRSSRSAGLWPNLFSVIIIGKNVLMPQLGEQKYRPERLGIGKCNAGKCTGKNTRDNDA